MKEIKEEEKNSGEGERGGEGCREWSVDKCKDKKRRERIEKNTHAREEQKDFLKNDRGEGVVLYVVKENIKKDIKCNVTINNKRNSSNVFY